MSAVEEPFAKNKKGFSLPSVLWFPVKINILTPNQKFVFTS
jgi:hypothetical protein